ncbi:hypothetical protein C8R43DRAFT_955982 [Mycena crocata]|nr:hypothetical protein C8R43DRAFT_955982 [Mycena crocata]
MTKRTAVLSSRKKSKSLAAQASFVSTSSEVALLSKQADFEDDHSVPGDTAYSPGNTQFDPDSDPITPPPPPTRRKPVHRATTVSDSDSSNSEKPAPKKRAKKKHAKEVEAVVPGDADRKLVLLIPRAELEGSQRQVLSHTTTYEEALDVIYAVHLSTATVKTEAISLSSVDDWAGCLEDVTDIEKKKAVSVKIIVKDQYLLSLRAKLGVKATGPKPKGKRIPVLDLDHAQDGEDDFDDDLGIMDKEKQFLEQLQTAHGRCQLCGPTKACKINVAGEHHHLSNNQLRGWSHSLVITSSTVHSQFITLLQAIGTHNITLKAPPNDTLFAMFFKNSCRTPSNSASTPFAMPPFMGANAMNPYGFMPWDYLGMAPPFAATPMTPATPTPAPASGPLSSKMTLMFPSSDPPEMGALNPYPEITSFLMDLDGYQPRRRLFQYVQTFEDLNLYNIDELVRLKTPEELVSVAGHSLENAIYVMQQARDEMKCVDRESKARAREA